jgi:hypothetical protein
MTKAEIVYYLMYRDAPDTVRPIWRWDTRVELMRFFGRNETSTVQVTTLCSAPYFISTKPKSNPPSVYIDVRKSETVNELVTKNLEWNLEPCLQDIVRCIHVNPVTSHRCETIAPHTTKNFRVQQGKVEHICRSCMRDIVAESNRRKKELASSGNVPCLGYGSSKPHFIADKGIHEVSSNPRYCKECYNQKGRDKYDAQKRRYSFLNSAT